MCGCVRTQGALGIAHSAFKTWCFVHGLGSGAWEGPVRRKCLLNSLSARMSTGLAGKSSRVPQPTECFLLPLKLTPSSTFQFDCSPRTWPMTLPPVTMRLQTGTGFLETCHLFLKPSGNHCCRLPEQWPLTNKSFSGRFKK